MFKENDKLLKDLSKTTFEVGGLYVPNRRNIEVLELRNKKQSRPRQDFFLMLQLITADYRALGWNINGARYAFHTLYSNRSEVGDMKGLMYIGAFENNAIEDKIRKVFLCRSSFYIFNYQHVQHYMLKEARA